MLHSTIQTGFLSIHKNKLLPANKSKQPFAGLKTPVFKTLKQDTVSFKGHIEGTIKDLSYKNAMGERLTSTPNSDFDEKLSHIRGINNQKLANQRIAALSRYLKEDMIGFIVPEYTVHGEKKGGYEWFEKALPNLLYGATKAGKKGLSKEGTQKPVDTTKKTGKKEIRKALKKARKHPPVPDDFKSVAKELFSLLSLHDNYWKSNAFKAYLQRFDSTEVIAATIEAIEELQTPKAISFTGEIFKMYGYFSPLKVIPELLKKGGAYSTNELFFQEGTRDSEPVPGYQNASLEHIYPKSWGGECDDSNYMLASSKLNTERGNLPLITFLKGSNA